MNVNQTSSFLSSKKVTYATKGIMGAVVGTTILKAVGRPAFIMADKNSDPQSKKYTATKEFLYQILCLALTFAMVKPTQSLFFKSASKKYLKGINELANVKKFKDFEIVAKDTHDFTPKAKELLKTNKTHLSEEAKEKFNLVKGAVELGSFISSIVGLTIVAPLVSHELLHPIMKAIGMDDNKKEKNIGKPNEIFLADAKVAKEGKKIKADA